MGRESNMNNAARRMAQKGVKLKKCIICNRPAEERHHDDYRRPLTVKQVCGPKHHHLASKMS